MSNEKSLNSFNSKMLTMPKTTQETGAIVADEIDNGAGVVVVDVQQGVLIVYPKEALTDRPELAAESLPYLLSTFEITMYEDEYEAKTLHNAIPKEEKSDVLALFYNSDLEEEILCTDYQRISTKILRPTTVIACLRGTSNATEYRLRGIQIKTASS